MNLNQVTVPSLDLPKSITFYKLLGLHLIVEALPHYARFSCPEGISTFSVHLVEKLPEGDGIVVYFEVADVDKKVKELQDLRLHGDETSFDLLPTDQSWLWREARLKDHDGNRIILYFAGDNRKNPPWRLQ